MCLLLAGSTLVPLLFSQRRLQLPGCRRGERPAVIAVYSTRAAQTCKKPCHLLERPGMRSMSRDQRLLMCLFQAVIKALMMPSAE